MYDADKAIFKKIDPYTKRALSLKGASARTEITLQKAQNAGVVPKQLRFGREKTILRRLFYLSYNQKVACGRSASCPLSSRQSTAFTRSLQPFWLPKEQR